MGNAENIRELLCKISEDNMIAFNQFYDCFYVKVFRFCYCILRNKNACGEVVSDVFLSVWQSRKRLLDILNMELYLYIIAKNTCYRYMKNEKSSEYVMLDEIPVSVERLEDNPENDLLANEIENTLTEVINKLPEKSRIIFLMSRQDGLKYREIAEILGLAESTVHVQARIAIKKIVEQMKKYYPDIDFVVFLLLLLK
ncbi:RNA polymerase sigma factor [Parabacteroides bouchesdurhonensis]|uniref:RNA polymerase sigma factor n=2 Tax=Parabacteroides bouchesdurhonensis TaxID=1936995 RepID=UPI000E479008|nr:RNA polymerase sigma-70 factor [Parabacteroides bouchesdurhonensis]RHJ94222.1 RNA polymerase sigma-70 factor [Bacteroides sp. AM07-16]